MNVVAVFHAAELPGWEPIAAECLAHLARTPCRDLTVSFSGDPDRAAGLDALAEFLGFDGLPVVYDRSVAAHESPAMKWIDAFARRDENADDAVFYFHAKGSSAPKDGRRRRWREMMLRECLGRWGENVAALRDRDAVGCCWRDGNEHFAGHFAGNYWFARCSYLRTLPAFGPFWESALATWGDPRLACEQWIGAGPTPPRVLSRACRNVSVHDTDWLEKTYP